jgi:GNAT superfamily N-acetyltransferase
VSVSLEQINPRNEPLLRAWWRCGHDATSDRPGQPWPAWEQARVALPADDPERSTTLLAAIEGRVVVATGLLTCFLQDNLHAAEVDVTVSPARRREGIGSAVLTELETVAAGSGRSTLLGEGFVPPGGTAPCEPFAAARGYDVASRESIKELGVADLAARREALLAQVAQSAGDYRIVTFDTVCPDEHLASFGRLLGTLMAQIPLGGIDLSDSEWPPQRLRAAEQRQVTIGRHVLTALAIAPDGSVAGSSDVRVSDGRPTHGQVGITLVDPAHRGRRLGLALKLATHDLAVTTYAGLTTIETSNAEVNTHMNAVNEALGYRTIETLLELQKRL